jgi:hypothetical protein
LLPVLVLASNNNYYSLFETTLLKARIAPTMFKRILLIVLILVRSVYAQVPNYSFENWTNSNPDAWQTTNIPLVPVSILADSDAYDGLLSVKGIVVNSNNNLPYPPYLGISGGGATGFHITDRYSTVIGWCKLFLLPGDKFTGNVKIYNNIQEPIGMGSFSIDTSSMGWSPFSINIIYFDSDAVETCSLFFTITDSTELRSGQIGSYFLLDNLSMGTTVGQNEISDGYNVSVYPNPAHAELHIRTPEMKRDIFCSLIDLTGKEIFKNKLNSSNEVISFPHLSPGIYILNLYSDERRFVKKIIVE